MTTRLERGVIARSEITVDVVRKLELFRDPAINAKIAECWGNTRRTSAEKQQRILELKRQLSDTEYHPNLRNGNAVFARVCQQCHKLFGEGGNVGPEITGSQRANLDYLLLNVVDPSAAVGKDYLPWLIELEDGRVVVGIVTRENDRTLSVRTQAEELVIDKAEINEREQLTISRMPEGLFDYLTERELKDLVAYLRSGNQVPVQNQ